MPSLRCLAGFCLLFASTIGAQADWTVAPRGAWPQDWPAELDALRDQSGTIQGGLLDLPIHHIPFADRDQFEPAWPHLLKVKTAGAPVILLRSPHPHWHFGETVAGVLIHCPPGGLTPQVPEQPIAGVDRLAERSLNTTYIELVVDGRIVDLNRIRIPADTPIIDQRFDADQGASPATVDQPRNP